MNILGIETSCDETSVAVVRDGKKILSNEIASSLEFHKKYGGVIPEIASRMQLEMITDMASFALKEAEVKLSDIDLVCVTDGPGFTGSLVIGIEFAKSISQGLRIPLLGVNHVLSHTYASFLDAEIIQLPFVALVASGGHTSLFFIKDFHKVELLGETQDDACGEAFDKVAKILGLGYPGGPHIERIAKKGNSRKIKFSCSGTKKVLNFSFSGIKTAVLYYVNDNLSAYKRQRAFRIKELESIIADIAASFQEAAIDALIKKSLLACKLTGAKRLVTGGGVIANNRLRERLKEEAANENLQCYFPPRYLCMDNAAMVAGLGYQLFKKGYCCKLDLNVNLN